jgi:hypothetical protein
MRRYCSSPGIDYDETIDCAAGQRCEGGSCFACEPDRVECLGETTFRACFPDGSKWGPSRFSYIRSRSSTTSSGW